MVIRECVWDVCVYISCTGDGQLGSSFLKHPYAYLPYCRTDFMEQVVQKLIVNL